jgi:hypothetical protein
MGYFDESEAYNVNLGWCVMKNHGQRGCNFLQIEHVIYSFSPNIINLIDISKPSIGEVNHTLQRLPWLMEIPIESHEELQYAS